MRIVKLLALVLLGSLASAGAQPTDRQVAHDAADFHRFRVEAMAHASEIDARNPGRNAGAKYIGAECAKLAQRTSPDYLYGIVTDLIQDTSRTEEPYLVAIMVLDSYPPKEARTVVKRIIADPKYKACADVKNWLWEIDEAEKDRKQAKSGR